MGRKNNNEGGSRRVWKPSALQRDYRRVLDLAKDAPQVLLDTDGDLLVIERKDQSDFRCELAECMRQAGRLHAALAANRSREPREWATQTDFPYLAAFGRNEVEEFARELLAYLLDASQRGTIENLRGNLRAWETTASIYEDPVMLAAMTAELDPAALTEVFPPSEEQAHADAA